MILVGIRIIAPIKKLQTQMMDYIENKDSGSVSKALLEGSKVHPTEIFEAINNSLNEQIESMMFVTPPLAAFNGVPYNSEDLSLHHGDVLFVYTDGVTEAASADDEFFGEDRLIAALNEVRDGSPEMIVGHVKKRVDDFSSGCEQFDDITMLCFKYL